VEFIVQPSKLDRKTILILIGLFTFAVAVMAIPAYKLLVEPRGQAFDLFWIWAGGQAVLSGDNPYGPETTRTIQLGVFNKIIPPHQYQHGFPHPAHIAFVLLPFVIAPFSWSVLIWISLQIPLFMVTLLLGFNILNWTIRPWLLFVLTFLTILGFRYPMNVYVLGQLIFFVLFCLLLSIWLYQRQHPRLAAIALALATIRPDLALLAIILAFILTRHSPHRNEFLATLLITGIILALLPALFIGFWPITWITAILSYGSNPFATWPPDLLPSTLAIVVLLIGLVIWTGRYVGLGWRNPMPYHISLMVSAVVLGGLIIFPQTGSYSLTFALIPAVILLHYAPQIWLKVAIALSLLMPWLYFVLDEPYNRLIFLLIPCQFVVLQEIVRFSHKHLQATPEASSPVVTER
jgi:hypothetical protein